MIELKEKRCKGQGKAISVKGCGELTKWRRYGLCPDCLANFLFGTDCGKLLMERSILPKAKSIVRKESKLKDKQARDNLKKLSDYEAEARKAFQKFIRLRDSGLPCISCGTVTAELWDGGHYKKAELYSGLIFNENNCHKQCRKCNHYLGGNELNYRSGLITRFGENYVLELEKTALNRRLYKYTKEELIDIKKKYNEKIKSLSL